MFRLLWQHIVLRNVLSNPFIPLPVCLPQSPWCLLSGQLVAILNAYGNSDSSALSHLSNTVCVSFSVSDVISSSELCDKWLLMLTSAQALMESSWPDPLGVLTGKTVWVHRMAAGCVNFHGSVLYFLTNSKGWVERERKSVKKQGVLGTHPVDSYCLSL